MIALIFAWLFGVIFAGILVYFCYQFYELLEHFEALEDRAERDSHQALKKMVELEVLRTRIFLLTNR